MQIFAPILFTFLSVLATIVAEDTSQCTSPGNLCTLYMSWSNDSLGLQAGVMEKPQEFEIYSKNCSVIASEMAQPIDKGPIVFTSPKLVSSVNVTGEDEYGGRPVYTYGAKKVDSEHCGFAARAGSFLWACSFPCEGANATWYTDPTIDPPKKITTTTKTAV